MSEVSLEINSRRYGGWETVHVEKSIENLSGAFTLSITEKWPGQDIPRAIHRGERCVLRMDKDVVLTGWVDEVEPSLEEDTHQITISGRDATGDLVDCSAITSPSEWNGQSLEGIARALLKDYGIPLIVQAKTGEPFKKFAIEQGETVFETIARMCKLRALLAISDGKGGLILTNSDHATKCVTQLVEGENIKRISSRFSDKEKFSEIHVKSQTQGSDTAHAAITTGWKGNAKDPTITRHRPLLIMAEGQSNGLQCQQRATWEVSSRQGKGEITTIDVAGWRQDNSEGSPLWAINSLVYVNSPTMKLAETLLISGVSFDEGENGTTTQLTLSPPSAYSLIREPEPKNS